MASSFISQMASSLISSFISRIAITDDLAVVFGQPSQMAITNRLATVFWWHSGMASGFISSFTSCFTSLSKGLALRLARYFGTDAQPWLNRQLSYDLKIA